MAIFLVPIIQGVLWGGMTNWTLIVSFLLFASLFAISLFYTVRLIIPVSQFYLRPPQLYYNEYRLDYEKQINDRMSIEDLLKASYVRELETMLSYNTSILGRKQIFYRYALIFALLSALPYMICFCFYISNQKGNSAEKPAIVSYEYCNL